MRGACARVCVCRLIVHASTGPVECLCKRATDAGRATVRPCDRAPCAVWLPCYPLALRRVGIKEVTLRFQFSKKSC